MSESGKYLLVSAGPHGVLLDTMAVIEIAEYLPGQWGDEVVAVRHHGQGVWWRDRERPYLDLRVILGLDDGGLAEPSHTVALAATAGGEAAVLLGVDGVQRILDVAADDWHWLQGVHPQLDRLFDRLVPDPATGAVWLRLRPLAAWWAGQAGEAP